MANTYETYALCAGTRVGDWTTRMYLYPTGEIATSGFFLWVLKGADGPIIVDTRFTHRLARHREVCDWTALDARHSSSRTRGSTRPRVNVILTHLHWDHFDVEGIFPRAVFWVAAGGI